VYVNELDIGSEVSLIFYTFNDYEYSIQKE